MNRTITDLERQTERFISDTTPAELFITPMGEPFRYDYTGFKGVKSHCLLQIDVYGLIICTEAEDNEGTGIAQMAAHLATRVCYQFELDPWGVVWIEHPAPRESWYLVKFDIVDSPDGVRRCLNPQRCQLDYSIVEALKPPPPIMVDGPPRNITQIYARLGLDNEADAKKRPFIIRNG